MSSPVTLVLLDPRYPSRLKRMARPPAAITICGGSLEAESVVAIVGSREATAEAEEFARKLASEAVEAGAVVVSGGAMGIDAAAHRGALQMGGRTWVVAGTGPDQCYPPENADLFDEIGRGPGAMIWPFSAGPRGAFLKRNRILVTLADAVVVVQAGPRSGALHAASCARKLRRPLWVVPASPWMDAFSGSLTLLSQGVRPLTSTRVFLASLRPHPKPGDPPLPNESRVLHALESMPIHLDDVVARSSLPVQLVSAVLLTLALENVVVEGPQGFFRRCDDYRS
jgi:DNA processing protein